MVIFQDMIWDRLEAFSDAMVALIVVEGERVQPLVNHMITSQPADRQQRLSIAFGHLASGNGLALDARDRGGSITATSTVNRGRSGHRGRSR